MGLVKRLFRRGCRGSKKTEDPPVSSPSPPTLPPPLQPQAQAPAPALAPPLPPPVKAGDIIILGCGSFNGDWEWKEGPPADASQHLGEPATVVALRDSWLEVRINNNESNENENEEQETFLWPESQVSSLTTRLSDDILSEVFSFLGESAASRKIFARRGESPLLRTTGFDEDNPNNNDNKRPVFALTSIRDIACLHYKLGSVCKRWKNICDDRLASIQGLVDADLIPTIGCNQLVLPALKWMCQYRLCIRSMRLTNARSHAPFIGKILRKQDITHMRELCLSFGLGQDSDETLAQIIVEECKDLEKLHFRYEEFGMLHQTMQDLSPKYQALSIKELVLEMGDTRGHLSQWVKLIPGMQSLQHVRFIGNDSPQSGYIQIKSDSLISLDVTGFRGCWVFCQCPKLESYLCTSVHYNIRMRRGGSLPLLSRNQFAALPSNVADILEVTSGSMPFLGVNVPPSCLITLRNFYFPIEIYYGFHSSGTTRGFDDYMRCVHDLELCLEHLTTAEL